MEAIQNIPNNVNTNNSYVMFNDDNNTCPCVDRHRRLLFLLLLDPSCDDLRSEDPTGGYILVVSAYRNGAYRNPSAIAKDNIKLNAEVDNANFSLELNPIPLPTPIPLPPIVLLLVVDLPKEEWTLPILATAQQLLIANKHQMSIRGDNL